MWECGEEQTDRHTDTQTAVANIHFASAMPQAKCNNDKIIKIALWMSTYPNISFIAQWSLDRSGYIFMHIWFNSAWYCSGCIKYYIQQTRINAIEDRFSQQLKYVTLKCRESIVPARCLSKRKLHHCSCRCCSCCLLIRRTFAMQLMCRCRWRVKLAQAVDATTSYVPLVIAVNGDRRRSKCCATGVNLVAI